MSETDSDTHKEKMKELQAAQAKRRRELKDPERGLVLVHTGVGKGKSSSAFGVIARALGWGQKVAVVQFIKGKWKTGEKKFFLALPRFGGLARHGRRFHMGYAGQGSRYRSRGIGIGQGR